MIDRLDDNSQAVTFSQPIEKEVVREKNEALIMDIVTQSHGVLCSLDIAATKLLCIDKKQRRRVPWNCDMTFGTNFKIKIASYVYVSVPNWFSIDFRIDSMKIVCNRSKIKMSWPHGRHAQQTVNHVKLALKITVVMI